MSVIQLDCKGRITYDTEHEAAIKADKYSYKYDRELEHYQCEDCGKWHFRQVTS